MTINLFSNISRILHELEAFICKALQGEAIVNYCDPLITHLEDPATRGDESFQLARRVKIDEKKHCPTCHSWLAEAGEYTILVK